MRCFVCNQRTDVNVPITRTSATAGQLKARTGGGSIDNVTDEARLLREQSRPAAALPKGKPE